MIAFIGVGSNLGNRLENIHRALDYLSDSLDIEIDRVSTIIETVPQGGPPQPKYLNGVIKIKTHLSAGDLLNILQTIEKKLGRQRLVKNGHRTIDLDILLYGDKVINEADLIVPHPRMRQREFVMKPLKEIEPQIKIVGDGTAL